MLIVHPSSCCDVCLEKYTWDDPAQLPYAIPCGHIFCETCLTAITPPNCPLCRNSFDRSTIKKLRVDHLETSEQQELELLRRLALSWGLPNDQQVKVLEEIDVWLGDREAEITSPCVSVSMGSDYSPMQGTALIKAREVAAKCQQLLRSKEQDERTIRELKREVQDYTPMDNALAAELYLLKKVGKIGEYVAPLCVITADDIPRELAQREADIEHLRTENSRRVTQYEAEMQGLRTENSRRVARCEAEIEALRTENNRRVAQCEAELEGLQTENSRMIAKHEDEMEGLQAENNRLAQCEVNLRTENDHRVALHAAKVECLKAELECLSAEVEYPKAEVEFLKAKAEYLEAEIHRQVAQHRAEVECLKGDINRHVAQKAAEVESLRAEITDSDSVLSLTKDLWTEEWLASPLASFRDLIVPSYKELQVRTKYLDDENHNLSRELEAVKTLLSEVRDGESEEARVFVANTDAISTADVIRQVTDLNCQIREMATHFRKLLQNVEIPVTTQGPVTETLDNASWMLGKQLASFLSANLLVQRAAACTVPDPLLADVVLQIAITRWCRFMISSWIPSHHTMVDFMKILYSGIRQFEVPAIRGCWRSITRAQLWRSSSDDLRWSEGFMQGLDSILDVAGWSIQEADRHQLEMRLPRLFEAVKDLRKVIREDITSIDLEVATIEAGTTFDTEYMEPHWMSSLFLERREERISDSEEVIGTTGLGLRARKDRKSVV